MAARGPGTVSPLSRKEGLNNWLGTLVRESVNVQGTIDSLWHCLRAFSSPCYRHIHHVIELPKCPSSTTLRLVNQAGRCLPGTYLPTVTSLNTLATSTLQISLTQNHAPRAIPLACNFRLLIVLLAITPLKGGETR